MKKVINLVESLIDRFPLFWQFFKFCLVGVSNLIIYLAVYWLMTRVFSWHYLPASVVGFLISVSWSFYCNLTWTFNHVKYDSNRRHMQFITFVVANLLSMAINLSLLALFIEVFKIYDLYAQLACSVIVAFFNFGVNRFWTFRKC